MSDRRWPIIITTLLALHVAACLVFLFLATSDPSLAVEEDYYAKSLAWDEHKNQLAANAALGWQATVAVIPAATPGGPTTLRLTLVDPAGAPVEGAALSGQGFAVARSRRLIDLAFSAAAPGVYEGSLQARRGGLWELRLVASRGDQRFTRTERVTLPSPPWAGLRP